MGLKPVSGNSIDKSCGESIGSSCVIWQGPAVPGTCHPSTLTDVITSINTRLSNCCGGSNTWIDIFSPTSPLPTGTGTGATYIVTGIASAGANNPQYNFTSDGDLKVRGALSITITTTLDNGVISIPLISLPLGNFPTNWNANQTILASVDFNSSNRMLNLTGQAYLRVAYPSGILYLDYYFVNIDLSPIPVIVDFGGTRFNFA